jgi:aspartate racemase
MAPRHIGIVACSAEGAALCYRTICIESGAILGPHAHPEVTVHTFSFADYMACISRNDWIGVSELMLASANKLQAVGADFLICPDNTIHQALPHMLKRSPLPWLHIAQEVQEKPWRAVSSASQSQARVGWSKARSIRMR